MKKDIDLHVTLWPSFPHFRHFASDARLGGIRLNSAMISQAELDSELAAIADSDGVVPLHFDIKGRQLRVTEVLENPTRLDIRLNHPIKVRTPTPVLFKAGADDALLERVEEDGHRLVFRGGPRFMVRPGESLHIRHHSLRVGGPQFTDAELAKIASVKAAGCKKWYLSYVESQTDVDEFLELVGRDAEVSLKIESKKGLFYAANEFKKKENLRLVAARGDLYVELEKPHEILGALRLIIEKDADALVGSRILLSMIPPPPRDDDTEALVPSCADFLEMGWLADAGYRSMMLCDELCLRRNLLASAVNAFDAFRQEYVPRVSPPKWSEETWLRWLEGQ
jgi:hypothetical protein